MGQNDVSEGQDERAGEIEARLKAATPGPWAFDGDEINNVPDYESDNPALWASVLECRVECMSYCYGGSVAMDLTPENRALIAKAPEDIAYLLAELQKRDEALAAALKLAEGWRYKGEHGWGAWQEGHGPDQEGYVLDGASADLRTVIRDAMESEP